MINDENLQNQKIPFRSYTSSHLAQCDEMSESEVEEKSTYSSTFPRKIYYHENEYAKMEGKWEKIQKHATWTL